MKVSFIHRDGHYEWHTDQASCGYSPLENIVWSVAYDRTLVEYDAAEWLMLADDD